MTGGGPRVLFAVAAMLARGTSRAERRRRRLLTSGAALATFFLLGAVNLLLIRGTTQTRWAGLVSEEELRPGTAFALALLVVPVLALLYQAGRVAQATQERRLAALRLAGATPADVRLLGAVEALRVGTVGAVVGGVAYVSGQQMTMAALGVRDTAKYAIPPWSVPAVLVLVVAAAAAISLPASRHVVVSPLSVARRASRPRPSAYTMLPLAIGVPLMVAGGFAGGVDKVGVPLFFLGAVATVVGAAAGASRVILESARLAGRWARTPETLLAARALEADPRAVGRTMAVVGLVVAFGAGTGAFTWEVIRTRDIFGDAAERFWLVSLGLTYLALLFALLVAVTALVVHRAETLLEGGRSTAALAAIGAPVASLRRAALRQTLIAATPVCAIGALSASIGMTPVNFADPDLPTITWAAGHALLMIVLAVTAAAAVTALSSRLLTRAAAPTHLRTE
ncbi:FtsX-like permease family protein [Actinomadura sp. 7K507]|uniref:FtsX-like permease family protein n=1 Tax=Actinomadura sp. 7K507 TaxID=2530365 RepID=UPI001052832A|nr:FtsX-like permease family protein [Actinomadura sp. 7K507]TDC87851.1 FtsX-like permease family protein [Actinomadura sp. 7K507]